MFYYTTLINFKQVNLIKFYINVKKHQNITFMLTSKAVIETSIGRLLFLFGFTSIHHSYFKPHIHLTTKKYQWPQP